MTPSVKRITVVVEDHYVAACGAVYAQPATGHAYHYWKHYLELFDSVRVLSRVGSATDVDPRWRRADGPGVEFVALPEHVGLLQAVRQLPITGARIARAIADSAVVFIRGTGPIGALAWLGVEFHRLPFARQVVGHDHEAFSVGLHGYPKLAASAVAAVAQYVTQLQVKRASTVAYVSPRLKRVYPPAEAAPVFFFSDVVLDNKVATGARERATFSARPLRLVSVGRLNLEKGHEVLLRAMRRLVDDGITDWSLEIIGEGTEEARLRTLRDELDLRDRVHMPGFVKWGPQLFSHIDSADLFVLPSLTEGMPRAMLEAMSRGLPVVGTEVGGVPDVLPAASVVPPGDADALAECVGGYVGNRERLVSESALAYEAASQWRPERMHKRRHDFWMALQQTAAAGRV